VPILEPARDVLKRWKAQQAAERLRAGPAWTESGLVFTSNIGTALFARNVSRRFHQLLDTAQLDRRGFHALRHSTATLLLTAGVNPKVVQELLGHSQISLTLDTYSHVVPTLLEEAGDKLLRLLGS
jgi:site-specific recombinase XerD